MRFFKPSTATVAAAAALVLAPAGAWAIRAGGPGRRVASPGGGCKLTIYAAPRFIENGESALLFGQLRCGGGTSAANQTVTVMERSAGTTAASAGTATTDAAGNYQLTSPALSADTSFYATALGAQSGERTVNVSPKVTLAGPPEGAELFTGTGPILHNGLHTGYRNRVTFTGTVSPADAGALVVLQREEATVGNEWHRIGQGTVATNGGFSITHTFYAPGDASIRVVVHPVRHKVNYTGVSETLTYEISQSQNQALTIDSSADPISDGQSTMISGTIAAPAGTSLTLWQRARLTRSFVAIAKIPSGAGGSYAFPVQTPAQSVFYRVAGAGKTSAVLYEGVKYVLNATPPASTAQAGQPITFTGSVTPVQPNHAVYLEVLNPLGIGFHVADVGTETSTGSFTIVHSQYIAGVKQYRIKVPGDPEYEGVASGTFTINVTPAPSAALTPELPGNTALPAEGQL